MDFGDSDAWKGSEVYPWDNWDGSIPEVVVRIPKGSTWVPEMHFGWTSHTTGESRWLPVRIEEV